MSEVKTSVDDLMELVNKYPKISVSEAAKKLKTHETTVQAWVDFLVEEHILGIEYKFTTPYIYVHDQEKLDRVKHHEESYSLDDYKNGFEQKAQEQNIPKERIPSMWKEHLRYVIASNKQFFIEECGRRGVEEAEDLYAQYEVEVLDEA